ncbi:hypothetical protein EVAR_75276_1 [Eumeta japonica]|uniref:Uncharacterized protein n=1 Tax=Eumeta variegata TaxID=151549 RepID=A0A4C1V8C0_EUMVA|nr:hypothetical protein EVAR_75276_1 [Eumeta japonica]
MYILNRTGISNATRIGIESRARAEIERDNSIGTTVDSVIGRCTRWEEFMRRLRGWSRAKKLTCKPLGTHECQTASRYAYRRLGDLNVCMHRRTMESTASQRLLMYGLMRAAYAPRRAACGELVGTRLCVDAVNALEKPFVGRFPVRTRRYFMSLLLLPRPWLRAIVIWESHHSCTFCSGDSISVISSRVCRLRHWGGGG